MGTAVIQDIFRSHEAVSYTHLDVYKRQDRYRANVLSSADNGAGVGGGLDFLQLMGDDNDGFSVIYQIVHDGEKIPGLLGSQNCGGLIQNQQLCPAVQGL